MTIAMLTKAPADILDYDVSFEDWLTEGDTILDISAELSGSTTAMIEAGNYTTSNVRVWIKGGELSETLLIDVKVVTAFGRHKTASFKVRIRECR